MNGRLIQDKTQSEFKSNIQALKAAKEAERLELEEKRRKAIEEKL